MTNTPSYHTIYRAYQSEMSERSSNFFMKGVSKTLAIRATASRLNIPMFDVLAIVNRETKNR